MTNVVFAFGLGETYFMGSPTAWVMNALPPPLYAAFSENPGIAQVYHMVLGTNGSYYVGFRGKNGRDYFQHSGLPSTLAAWIDTKDRKGLSVRRAATLRIALGPNNDSYFVHDTSGSQWLNLPQELNDAISKIRRPNGSWVNSPKFVTLGENGSYVMATVGGGGSWKVSPGYPELDKELDEFRAVSQGQGGMFNRIHYISLDPHDTRNFVLTTPSGVSTGWVPDSPGADAGKILNSIPKAAPTPAGARAQQRGSSGTGSRFLKAIVGGVVKGTLAGLTGQQYASSNSGGYTYTDTSSAGYTYDPGFQASRLPCSSQPGNRYHQRHRIPFNDEGVPPGGLFPS